MGVIGSFRELDVYRCALKEAKRIYRVTLEFPAEEKYSLTDQIRRSSRAVGAILAEAWARRIYKAAFVNKINEAMETQAWLDHAATCEYVSHEFYKELDEAWQSIGAMLNGMIKKADDFCKHAVK